MTVMVVESSCATAAPPLTTRRAKQKSIRILKPHQREFRSDAAFVRGRTCDRQQPPHEAAGGGGDPLGLGLRVCQQIGGRAALGAHRLAGSPKAWSTEGDAETVLLPGREGLQLGQR